MTVKSMLLVSSTLAGVLVASSAFAQSSPPVGTPNETGTPAQRAGATGAPVLQNAQPGSPASAAAAQTGAGATTNPVAANQSEGNVIGEIVVTANKREESLQQVPVAVSAFTSEKRDIVGIESIVDQTNYTPGLSYQPSLDRLSLRGVGRLTNAHTADSGTAIYVDGVFTTSTTEAGRDPMFVERTEILRGPQGTLYGRNAIGGAYNIISKQPNKEFTGEIRADFGNYDENTVGLRISGPLTSWLRASFGYQHIGQTEGYDKSFNGFPSENGVRDRDYYEFQLAGEIEKLDFWAYYGKQTWDDASTPGGGVHNGGSLAPPEKSYYGTGSIFPVASYAYNGAINVVGGGPIAGNINTVTGNLRAFQADTAYNDKLTHNDVARMHLTYHFPTFDVKYIGGFVRYDYHYIADTDGSDVTSYQIPLNASAPGLAALGGFNCAQLSTIGRCAPATVYFGTYNRYDEDEEFYSHEFNIASTWDGPLQYIAGLYFYHEYGSLPQDVYAPNQPQLSNPISAVSTVPAVADPTREYVHSNYFANISSKAAFAQLDWKALDTLKFTGGLRYTQDDKKVTEEERLVCYGLPSCGTDLTQLGSLAPAVDITLTQTGTLTAAQIAAGVKQQGVVSGITYNPLNGIASRRLQDGSNDLTGTAGVEWTPDRRTLIYGKYSRGYKAFGFNSPVAAGLSQFPYTAPEQMDAFEVGLKKDWTRRFQTNITGFYDMYYDAQVPVSIPQNGGPALSVFYNIPRSIIQGVELESIWEPVDHLNVSATYAYLDAHITKATGIADPNDPTATQPGATPAGGNVLGSVDTITGLPSRGQNLAGQALPLSPKNKLAINANYTYSIGDFGDLIPSVSYIWRDEQYSSIFNRSYNLSPSRDQVDLRITFKDAKNRFSIIGYAQNVTDNVNFETKSGVRYSNGQVYSTYVLTDPRTYGVQLQYRF